MLKKDDKSFPNELTQLQKKLVQDIPIVRRKRMVRCKAYREGWADCTEFWGIQFNKTFDESLKGTRN